MPTHKYTESLTRSHPLPHALTPHSDNFAHSHIPPPTQPSTYCYPLTHPLIHTPTHPCGELTHSSTHSQPCTYMYSLAQSLSLTQRLPCTQSNRDYTLSYSCSHKLTHAATCLHSPSQSRTRWHTHHLLIQSPIDSLTQSLTTSTTPHTLTHPPPTY